MIRLNAVWQAADSRPYSYDNKENHRNHAVGEAFRLPFFRDGKPVPYGGKRGCVAGRETRRKRLFFTAEKGKSAGWGRRR